MKTNHKNIVSFAITVQIFILLCATVAVPATAAEAIPEFPLVVGGTVEVNGEPAPVGTVITAGLNDEIVGTTQVDCEGVCGYCPENKLYITCAADDYGDLKFYVDGVESQLVDIDALINAKPGDILTSVLIASTGSGSGSTTGGSTSTGGSSSGSAGYSTTGDTDQDEAIGGVTSETSSKTTLKSTKTAQSIDSAEQVPASEKRSSMDSIGLVMFGVILLIAAIAGVRYTLKNS